ncbi:unnamed protein product [Closterium sp. NIES-53]
MNRRNSPTYSSPRVHAWNAAQTNALKRHYAGDAIFRTTAEEKMQKMYLIANLLKEDLGKSKGREMQMAMENAKLKEENARINAEFEAFKSSVAAS